MKENLHSLKKNTSMLVQILIETHCAAGEIF